MLIGVLALQGAVEPHRAKFSALGVPSIPVRTKAELETCDGLVLPGGESTTLLKLIDNYDLQQPLVDFGAKKPVWGVCAGAILMAKSVTNPSQRSLGLMPITIRRNGYGRQNESFVAGLELSLPAIERIAQEGVFIRAPQVENFEEEVTVLATYEESPVALAYNGHLLTTFHPELSPGEKLHSYFLELIKKNSAKTAVG